MLIQHYNLDDYEDLEDEGAMKAYVEGMGYKFYDGIDLTNYDIYDNFTMGFYAYARAQKSGYDEFVIVEYGRDSPDIDFYVK